MLRALQRGDITPPRVAEGKWQGLPHASTHLGPGWVELGVKKRDPLAEDALVGTANAGVTSDEAVFNNLVH